jgi:RimJ/RimL family protein N-acetyltransferase
MSRLRWPRGGHLYEAIEPDAARISDHAATLARWYNAHENASMMGGSGTMTIDDVVTFYRELAEAGGRGFFCFADGELVGDMDLRSMRGSTAEFAVMIGDSARKGRGLGRTFATMIHVFGFRDLGLARVYAQPRKENVVVQRLERRLGYELDSSAEARSHADDDDSITMSLAAEIFRASHARAWVEVEVA